MEAETGATNQGTPVATRKWKRQGTDFPGASRENTTLLTC